MLSPRRSTLNCLHPCRLRLAFLRFTYTVILRHVALVRPWPLHPSRVTSQAPLSRLQLVRPWPLHPPRVTSQAPLSRLLLVKPWPLHPSRVTSHEPLSRLHLVKQWLLHPSRVTSQQPRRQYPRPVRLSYLQHSRTLPCSLLFQGEEILTSQTRQSYLKVISANKVTEKQK